jgi:hypothetical protein
MGDIMSSFNLAPIPNISQGFQNQLADFESNLNNGLSLGHLVSFPGSTDSTSTQQSQPAAPVQQASLHLNPFLPPGYSLSRLVAFLLGLIAIAGAIFLFKPESLEVVKTGVKGALA